MTHSLRARKTRIAISGLSAAGKTTLSRRIVRDHNLSYVSGSQILRELLGDSSPTWTPALDRRRTTLSVERQVDQSVLERFSASSEGVFDTWSLPWLARGKAENIWIESDRDSRIRKCMVSHLERGESISYAEGKDIVTTKDKKSRTVLLANWDFDIYSDRSPFNLLLDASELIPEVSIDAARRGAGLLYIAALRGLELLRAHGNTSAPAGDIAAEAQPEGIDALILALQP